MSAPAPSRYTPFLQSSLHTPSVPIPIPVQRKTSDPPPRSPDRYQPSSDLLFDMSPVFSDDSPLKHSVVNQSTYHRKLYAPFRPLPGAHCPENDNRPYQHEPFLYSVPKITSRTSQQHLRSQSEVLTSSVYSNTICPTSNAFDSATGVSNAQAKTTSARSPLYSPGSSPSRSICRCGDKLESPHVTQNPLTSAFQESVSPEAYLSVTSYSASPDEPRVVSRPISPSPSVYDQHGCVRSNRASPITQRKGIAKGTYPVGIMRTSTAAPVLSFAQVELNNPMTNGMFARETRVVRNKPKTSCSPCSLSSRARSPYAFARGRRNSIMRERSMRLSDEELSGTPRSDEVPAKFGLEKYLPGNVTRRVGRDENISRGELFIEKERERGRTRSRGRGGLRA